MHILQSNFCEYYPVIKVKISLAKVIITPPARVRNPLALWDGSWLFRDKPICTIPKPSSSSVTFCSFISFFHLKKGKLIATAYFANSCEIAAQIANLLGFDDDAVYYRKLREKIIMAYEIYLASFCLNMN
jgi:hypothetical protein